MGKNVLPYRPPRSGQEDFPFQCNRCRWQGHKVEDCGYPKVEAEKLRRQLYGQPSASPNPGQRDGHLDHPPVHGKGAKGAKGGKGGKGKGGGKGRYAAGQFLGQGPPQRETPHNTKRPREVDADDDLWLRNVRQTGAPVIVKKYYFA